MTILYKMNKHILLIFSLLLVTIIEKSQKNNSSIHFKITDPDFLYDSKSFIEIDHNYYDLESIESSSSKEIIRFNYEDQIVELRLNQDDQYKGVLINRIKERICKKDSLGEIIDYPKRFFYQKIDLDKDKVGKVYEKILEVNYLEMPTDSLIENWKLSWLHCRSCIICESKIKDKIRQQQYSCWDGQPDTISELKNIKFIYDLLESQFQLDSLFEAFLVGLPGGSFYSNNGYNRYYRRTQEQDKEWELNRNAREYLTSVKDTIFKTLKDQVSGIKEDCYCSRSIKVLFKPNGKKNIVYEKLNCYYGLKPFEDDYFYELFDILGERLKHEKCKIKARRILKTIDLKSLEIEYAFERSLNIKEDYIYFWDYTEYEDIKF